MKHELVVTFSTLDGSRDVVISYKAKIAFYAMCLTLMGTMVAMGATLVSTLSSLTEARAQLSSLHNQSLVQPQKVQAAARPAAAMTIAANWEKPVQPLPTKDVESKVPEPRPVSTPSAPVKSSVPRPAGERTLLLNLIPNGSPLKKVSQISSSFGKRMHPILRRLRNHRGIDFAAKTGTPVYATASGIVAEARKNTNGYGQQIVIEHALGFSSRYAHLSRLLVKSGDHVAKGALLGQSGNSGRSTGPHLHYEVLYWGKSLNPLNFVRWSNTNYHAIFTEEKGVPWASLKNQSQWSQLASLPFSLKVVR